MVETLDRCVFLDTNDLRKSGTIPTENFPETGADLGFLEGHLPQGGPNLLFRQIFLKTVKMKKIAPGRQKFTM